MAVRALDAITGHPLATIIADETTPLVWIEADLPIAAIENLLNNAGHHTPPGTPIRLDASINRES